MSSHPIFTYHSSTLTCSNLQTRASFLLGGESPPSSHNTTLPAVLHSHSSLQVSS